MTVRGSWSCKVRVGGLKATMGAAQLRALHAHAVPEQVLGVRVRRETSDVAVRRGCGCVWTAWAGAGFTGTRWPSTVSIPVKVGILLRVRAPSLRRLALASMGHGPVPVVTQSSGWPRPAPCSVRGLGSQGRAWGALPQSPEVRLLPELLHPWTDHRAGCSRLQESRGVVLQPGLLAVWAGRPTAQACAGLREEGRNPGARRAPGGRAACVPAAVPAQGMGLAV